MTHVRRSASVLALVALAACQVSDLEVAGASLDAEGLRTLIVDTRDGSLSIRGDAEATAIVAEVTVYGAEKGDAVERLVFSLDAVGDEARLDVAVEGRSWPVAWADVVVTVPARMAIAGSDGSGAVLVEDVASVDLRDGSGEVVARRIAGDVRIDDGSGDLVLEEVGGDAIVFDGSGDLVVRDVIGDADVEDGSGDLTVDGVDGTVTILDESGDIHVGEVGDLVLVGDGSGDVFVAY